MLLVLVGRSVFRKQVLETLNRGISKQSQPIDIQKQRIHCFHKHNGINHKEVKKHAWKFPED